MGEGEEMEGWREEWETKEPKPVEECSIAHVRVI